MNKLLIDTTVNAYVRADFFIELDGGYLYRI